MNESLKAVGRIDISVYDAEEFNDLSQREQELLSRDPELFGSDGLTGFEAYLAEETPTKVRDEFTYNTTTVGLHEYIVDSLDVDQTVDQGAAYLGLGNDDTPEDKTNRSLNNEIYRKTVTDHADNGNELITSTFLGSDDAQEETIREVALFSQANGGTMFNHSTIPEIVKDRTNTMSIDVVLSFDSA